jgi:hypothetical protein
MSTTGEAHDDSVANFDLGDLLAHGDHHTGALVT